MKSWNEAEKNLLIRGIPENFVRATWNDFNFKERDDEKKGYPMEPSDFGDFINNNEQRGFFFTGPCGSGKSMLASIIMIKLYLRGKSFYFRNVRDLKNEYLVAVRNKNKIDMLDKYSNIDYFVLNDLGAEKLGEGTVECIFSILDNRESANKFGIIITSNLDLNEIEEKVMDRIPSRIQGLCGDPSVFPKIDWRTREDRFDPIKAKPIQVYNEPKEDRYVPSKEEVQTCFDKMRKWGIRLDGNKWISMYEHLLRRDQLDILRRQSK